MVSDSADFDLSLDERRAVVRYGIECAGRALPVFTSVCPQDLRPRSALEHARAFADGAARTKALRDAAWAAQRAAHDALALGQAAATEAAYAARAAAGAGFLHPLARATQVKHILGAAAHAAHALELAAGDDTAVGDRTLAAMQALAGPVLVEVLRRYPAAPPHGGRVGQLLRTLDLALR